MLRLLSVLVLLLAPVASAQSDPALWRLLPPTPKALISIDWKALRGSHLGVMLREKFVDANPAQAIPGAEFLNEVDRCLIASNGRSPGNLTTEPALLIVVRGRFDLAKVRQVLADHGVKPQIFNSIQVYRPQGPSSRDMAIVLLDPQTIVLGDANSVFTSVDRNANPSQPAESSAIMAHAAEMDSRYDVWAIMHGLEGMSGNRLMNLLAGGGFSSQARSFEAGISVRNGLEADISFIFPTEPEARSMVSEFSGLIKAAIKDKTGGPAMLDLEKKLKVTADGSIAKITLRLSAQELEKNARIFAQTRHEPQAPPLADLKPGAGVVPAQPPKPAAKVIRIEGLDDGPREIVLKPEHQ